MTEKQVESARRLYWQGETVRTLAKRYGVHYSTVSRALRGTRRMSKNGRRRRISEKAKLTAAQVRMLRRLYVDKGLRQDELAEKFAVSQATVSNILLGRVYKSVA